jgi:AcrR family transcriptional regulator
MQATKRRASVPEAPTPRDADKTRALFLAAVETVLREEGLQGLGINAVARAAGRDKALIYKYFGSLEGLYYAFAETYSLFPTLAEMLGPSRENLAGMAPLEIARAAASGYLREIRKRPLTLEILRWELVVRNPLTDALAKVRSAATSEFNRMLGDPKGLDVPAVTALLYGGIVYLLLKADGETTFNGMDLGQDATWKRIEATLHRLLESLLK